MVDPIINFLNSLVIIYSTLPLAFTSLVGLVAVLSVVIIILKVVRAL
jgi:hypothetical protein